MRLPCFTLFSLLILIGSTSPRSEAKTVLVPEEVSNLSTAIETSMDGDVISLAPGEYEGYFRINHKNIAVTGRDGRNPPRVVSINDIPSHAYIPYCSSPALEIHDASIRLDGLVIQGIFGPGLFIDDANAQIADCEIIGTTTALPVTILPYEIVPSQPALLVKNSKNRAIHMQRNRLIKGKKADIDVDQGPTWLIDSCTNTVIHGHGNRVTGSQGVGGFDKVPMQYQGGHALEILSSDIRLELNEDFIIGGKGADGTIGVMMYTYLSLHGLQGGTGCLIDHSTVWVEGGTFAGGEGGIGGEMEVKDRYSDKMIRRSISAGAGGHGMVIRNGSQVTLKNATLIGQTGAFPDGANGQEAWVDETSTLTRLGDSPVKLWMLYEP